MTDRRITLSGWEAEAAARGALRTLVRPVIVPVGCRILSVESDACHGEDGPECARQTSDWYVISYDDGSSITDASPLGAPGDVLLCREGKTRTRLKVLSVEAKRWQDFDGWAAGNLLTELSAILLAADRWRRRGWRPETGWVWIARVEAVEEDR